MRKKEGCSGDETCTSIKSQEMIKQLAEKVLECGRNRPAEIVFTTKK